MTSVTAMRKVESTGPYCGVGCGFVSGFFDGQGPRLAMLAQSVGDSQSDPLGVAVFALVGDQRDE